MLQNLIILLTAIVMGLFYYKFSISRSKDAQNMYQHRPYGWLYRHEPCSYRLIVCQHDTM